MKLVEVLQPEVSYIRDIKNVLVFLKMKGINNVSTSAVIRELAKKGVMVDQNEIIDIISKFPFVDDVSAEKIMFKTNVPDAMDDIEKADVPSDEDDIDLNDERVKNMAKSAMNRRK